MTDDPRDVHPDEGGDPACWLAGVCPECGRFVAAEPPTACPRCGTGISATNE